MLNHVNGFNSLCVRVWDVKQNSFFLGLRPGYWTWQDQHFHLVIYMWSWCHIAICLLGFLSISSQWFLSVPTACRPRLHLPSKRFCPSASWLSISSSTLEAQSRSWGTSNMIISFHTGLILCFACFVCFFFSFKAWCFSVTLTDISAGIGIRFGHMKAVFRCQHFYLPPDYKYLENFLKMSTITKDQTMYETWEED